MPRLALDGNPIFECEWRRIGHQCGGVNGSQRDNLEPVAGLRMAAAHGGSVKRRRLGQICVGTYGWHQPSPVGVELGLIFKAR